VYSDLCRCEHGQRAYKGRGKREKIHAYGTSLGRKNNRAGDEWKHPGEGEKMTGPPGKGGRLK